MRQMGFRNYPQSLQDISESSFKLGKDFLLHDWNVCLVKILRKKSHFGLLAKYYCELPRLSTLFQENSS